MCDCLCAAWVRVWCVLCLCGVGVGVVCLCICGWFTRISVAAMLVHTWSVSACTCMWDAMGVACVCPDRGCGVPNVRGVCPLWVEGFVQAGLGPNRVSLPGVQGQA